MNSHHGHYGPSDYHDGADDGDDDVDAHAHARGYPYGYGYDGDVHDVHHGDDDADVDDGGHYYDDDRVPSPCLQWYSPILHRQ